MRERTYRSIIKNIVQYKHNSIVIRNFILIVVMMILPFTVITMSVKMSMERMVEQEIEDANENALFTTIQMLEGVLDRMFSFSYYLSIDDDFIRLQMFQAENVIDRYNVIYDDKVRINALIEEYVDSVYIYIEKQNIVLYNDKGSASIGIADLEQMADQSWLPFYKKMDEDQNYSLGMRIKGELYPYLLTMIVPFEHGGEVSGAIITNIDMRRLIRYLGHDNEKEQKIYMVGKEGELYYSNQELLLGNNVRIPDYLEFAWQYEGTDFRQIGEDNCVVTVQESDTYPCRYVLCTLNERYENYIGKVDSITKGMVIISLILGIIVAYIVTIYSFTPIQRIINEIERPDLADEENAEEVVMNGEQDFNNEVHYVTEMVRKAKKKNIRYQLETGKWMEKLNNAQMIALQSQINPHYLYNTLNMINWKAVQQLGLNNSVSEMISALSRFFSIGLQRNSYLIMIGEELEHAKLYAKILAARYEETISVKWDVSEEILSFKAIRLTIQPLIENAVYHGLRPKRYEGNITIRGGCVGDYIYLTVEDDGVGMEDTECIRLNYELLNHYETESAHIGIRNVNQRIKIVFGDDYGVNLRRNESGGLDVSMILPKKE